MPLGLVGELAADLPEPGVGDPRARRRLRSIPATLRSSTTTVPYSAAEAVVSLCRASARRFATRWCTCCGRCWPSPTASTALSGAPVRARRRETRREARRSRLSARSSGSGSARADLAVLSAMHREGLHARGRHRPPRRAGPRRTRSRSTRPGRTRTSGPARAGRSRTGSGQSPASMRRGASGGLVGRIVPEPGQGDMPTVSSIRIVPVVNRQDRRALRFDLKRGSPSVGPCACRASTSRSCRTRPTRSPGRCCTPPWSSPPTRRRSAGRCA